MGKARRLGTPPPTDNGRKVEYVGNAVSMTTPLVIELVLKVETIPGPGCGRPSQTTAIDRTAKLVPASSYMPVSDAD